MGGAERAGGWQTRSWLGFEEGCQDSTWVSSWRAVSGAPLAYGVLVWKRWAASRYVDGWKASGIRPTVA